MCDRTVILEYTEYMDFGPLIFYGIGGFFMLKSKRKGDKMDKLEIKGKVNSIAYLENNKLKNKEEGFIAKLFK